MIIYLYIINIRNNGYIRAVDGRSNRENYLLLISLGTFNVDQGSYIQYGCISKSLNDANELMVKKSVYAVD